MTSPAETEETERLAAETLRYALGHLVCPSCGTTPGACCRCRGAIDLPLQGLTEDTVEVLRGRTDPPREHLWCPGCLSAYARDLEALRRDVLSRHNPAELTMLSTARGTLIRHLAAAPRNV